MTKPDIQSRADLKQIIERFYEVANQDELLGPIFLKIFPLNFETHIPITVDFWDSILFYSAIYKNNVMLKHIVVNKKIKLTKEHFDRWLQIFQDSIDTLFVGETADLMKQKADLMAQLMEIKMRDSEQTGFIQ